jgi:hypothetical protein
LDGLSHSYIMPRVKMKNQLAIELLASMIARADSIHQTQLAFV